MRIVMAAVGAVFVGLLAVGVLGVANAETTPSKSTPTRIVSAEGLGDATVESDATVSTATAVYREAMAAAIVDGKQKAQFLAEKAGASLGQVQTIAEDGGYISCPGEEVYTGGEPDFGSAQGVTDTIAPASASPSAQNNRNGKGKAHKRRKRHTAKAAAVEPCSLSAQVLLSYELT